MKLGILIAFAFVALLGLGGNCEAAGLLRGRSCGQAAAACAPKAAACATKTVTRQRVVVLRRGGC